jgi:hypothetical protein
MKNLKIARVLLLITIGFVFLLSNICFAQENVLKLNEKDYLKRTVLMSWFLKISIMVCFSTRKLPVFY